MYQILLQVLRITTLTKKYKVAAVMKLTLEGYKCISI